jgi:hypothetical protein
VEIKIRGNSQGKGIEVHACPSSQAYVAKQDLTPEVFRQRAGRARWRVSRPMKAMKE